MDLLHALDIISTFVFALVGARVAADRGLDYGGIAFIATIASIAGGTLRNVFLGLTPVWLNDPWILASVLTAVIITLSLRRVTHVGKILLALDTFALAVATLSGAQLAFELGDLLAQGRLHQVQVQRGAADAAQLDLPHKITQLPQFHGNRHWGAAPRRE